MSVTADPRPALVVEGAPTGYLRPQPELTSLQQAELFLSVLHRPNTLIELRAKAPERGMLQSWHDDPHEAAIDAVQIGELTDVYVGVLPRTSRNGGKASVASSRLVWVECDSPHSLEQALMMHPKPNMVVRSSPGRGHVYWSLKRPLSPEHTERACKRMAWHLGADMAATDCARILRVPGTYNHKRAEPRRVFLSIFGGRNADPSFMNPLQDPPAPPTTQSPRPSRPRIENPTVDLLRALPSAAYVPRLSGREVCGHMVQCPFHGGGQERTPSLHVKGPDSTMWFCHGCGDGDDIFGFAARLWNLSEHNDFPAIIERLTRELG